MANRFLLTKECRMFVSECDEVSPASNSKACAKLADCRTENFLGQAHEIPYRNFLGQSMHRLFEHGVSRGCLSRDARRFCRRIQRNAIPGTKLIAVPPRPPKNPNVIRPSGEKPTPSSISKKAWIRPRVALTPSPLRTTTPLASLVIPGGSESQRQKAHGRKPS